MKKIFTTALLLISIAVASIGQNVGVGTNSPAEKLHVAGNVKADTVKPNAINFTPNAGTGKVLTSDASGNASWQKLAGSGGEELGYGSWGDCSMSSLSEYLPVADPPGTDQTYLGCAVAVYGNFAVIGRYGDDINGVSKQGSADIYEFNGTTWVFKQRLYDISGNGIQNFGYSVAMCNNYIAIGARGTTVNGNFNQGAVFIYRNYGGTWIYYQKITDPTGTAQDEFGWSVAITEEYVVAGAPLDNTDDGSICVFRNTGSNWAFQQKLLDPTTSATKFFGYSVSVSGKRIIAGSPSGDVSAGSNNKEGTAHIFHYNDATSTWSYKQILAGAQGLSVAESHFGYSVSISGDYAVVGMPDIYDSQGQAIFFFYNGTNWVKMNTVYDLAGDDNDQFGHSVFMSGDYAIVGAIYDNLTPNSQEGSATIYKRIGPAWGKMQYVTDKAGIGGDSFGCAVSIDGNNRRFLVGAENHMLFRGKAVFGKLF